MLNPSSSVPSVMEGARHFAVALGAGAFKIPTVADLVRAIANAASHAHHATARASTRRGSAPSSSSCDLPMAVLCGSRDAVDDVAAACSKLGVIRALHADQDVGRAQGGAGGVRSLHVACRVRR